MWDIEIEQLGFESATGIASSVFPYLSEIQTRFSDKSCLVDLSEFQTNNEYSRGVRNLVVNFVTK